MLASNAFGALAFGALALQTVKVDARATTNPELVPQLLRRMHSRSTHPSMVAERPKRWEDARGGEVDTEAVAARFSLDGENAKTALNLH